MSVRSRIFLGAIALVCALAAVSMLVLQQEQGAQRQRSPQSQPATADPTTKVPSTSTPMSAGPVPVHVLPVNTPLQPPSTAPVGLSTPQSLPSLTPQPVPSIAMGANGLPPGVPYASESDPVRIESVTMNSDDLHGGDIASARVVTTSNAAALTARIGTYQVSVPRTAPGIFSIAIQVPHLPVVSHTVDIIVTAIRSDGATAQTSVPIKVSF